MKIFLSEKELEVLKKAYKEEKPKIDFPKIQISNNKAYLDSDEGILVELRELCSEYLMRVGFNSEYNVNNDGEILEGLIDKFYIE